MNDEALIDITFIEKKEVKNHAGRVVERFRAGQRVKKGAASAQHFLSRGCAMLTEDYHRQQNPVPDEPEEDDDNDVVFPVKAEYSRSGRIWHVIDDEGDVVEEHGSKEEAEAAATALNEAHDGGE